MRKYDPVTNTRYRGYYCKEGCEPPGFEPDSTFQPVPGIRGGWIPETEQEYQAWVKTQAGFAAPDMSSARPWMEQPNPGLTEMFLQEPPPRESPPLWTWGFGGAAATLIALATAKQFF